MRLAPFGLLAATVALLTACSGCDSADVASEVEFRVPVRVEEVRRGDVEDRIVATGTMRATELVSLQVETEGVLEIGRNDSGRRWGEGDRVECGDLIAEITGEDVRLAARTAATREAFETARSEYDGQKKLFDKGVISESELSKARSELEAARHDYDRSLQAEKRNKLVTPIDGVILRLARDAQGQPLASGQLVTEGFEVAQIAPTDRLVAEVDLVGPDVARVSVGLAVRVRHYAWDDRRFEGTVIRLAPTIDPVTRALRAEIEVDNSGELLRPGMFVEVTIIGEQRQGVPVVPRDAVANRGGKWVVFILKGQRVSRREVVLGLGDDDIVEVREGLEAGERVVVRGLETLTDQTRVRLTGSSS